MHNVPTSLNNLKTKVDDLDVGKLKAAPIDLKSDVVDNQIVKNTKYNTLKTKVIKSNKIVRDTTVFIPLINTTQINKT